MFHHFTEYFVAKLSGYQLKSKAAIKILEFSINFKIMKKSNNSSKPKAGKSYSI